MDRFISNKSEKKTAVVENWNKNQKKCQFSTQITNREKYDTDTDATVSNCNKWIVFFNECELCRITYFSEPGALGTRANGMKLLRFKSLCG